MAATDSESEFSTNTSDSGSTDSDSIESVSTDSESDSKFRTIEKASRTVGDRQFVMYHLDSCKSRSDVKLSNLAARNLWHSVLEMLRRGRGGQQRVAAIDAFISKAPGQAVSHNNDSVVWKYSDIIPFCSRSQLQNVLARSMDKKWWDVLLEVLKQGVVEGAAYSSAVDLFIDKASKGVAPTDNPLAILSCLSNDPTIFVQNEYNSEEQESDYSEIIPFCNNSQLERVMTRATRKGWWDVVVQALKKDVWTESQKLQVVDLFIDEAPKCGYSDILPYCNSDQLDRFLHRARMNGWWYIVFDTLKTGRASEEQKQLATEEAKTKLSEKDKLRYVPSICTETERQQKQKQSATESKIKLDDLQFYMITQNYTETQLTSMLAEFVSEGQWQSVIQMFQNCFSDNVRKQAVDSIIEKAPITHFSDIISFCDDDQLERALERAATNGCVNTVADILHQNRVQNAEKNAAAIDACLEKVDTALDCNKILPFCNKKQLCRILATAKSEGWWETVLTSLQRMPKYQQTEELTDEEKTSVCKTINSFIRKSSFENYADIIQYCDANQLEKVLARAIKNKWWDIVLSCSNASRKQRRTALRRRISEATSREELSDVLHHCKSDTEFEKVLDRAFEEKWWDIVLSCSKASRKQRRTALRRRISETSREELSDVLRYCNSDTEFAKVLDRAFEKKWWDIVLSCSKASRKQRRIALHRYIREASRKELSDVLRYCNSDTEFEKTLDRALQERWWDIVLSCSNASGDQRLKALRGLVGETCRERLSDVLRFCKSNDERNEILTTAVNSGWWKVVVKVLEEGVSDQQRLMAVESASGRVRSDGDFCMFVTKFCHASDRLDSVLENLVARGQISSVSVVLNVQGIVSDKTRKKAVDACISDMQRQSYERKHFDITQFCNRDQLERLLTIALDKRWWTTVDRVMKRGVSEARIQETVNRACESADDSSLAQYMLPYCKARQLKLVLPQLVSRGRLRSVIVALENGVRGRQSQEAVDAFIDRAKLEKNSFYTKPSVALDILPFCNVEQLGRFLTKAAETGCTISTDNVLTRVQDTAQSTAVDIFVDKGSQHCCLGIAPYCTNHQLERLLNRALGTGWWDVVDKIMEKGVSDAQQKVVLSDALKKANDKDFRSFMLHHYRDEQLEWVLKQLVTRNMWLSVGKTLDRGVSDPVKSRAVEKAVRKAADSQFANSILRHCRNDQLDTLLTRLVDRGLWWSVGKLLSSNSEISHTKRQWAIEESSRRVDQSFFIRFILPCCDSEHYERVLPHLVNRGFWKSACEILERRVSDELHTWVVEEACKRADSKELKENVLPLCDNDQRNSMIVKLVDRALWECVGLVLKMGVSDAQHRWAIDAASKKSGCDSFNTWILPHCPSDQLEYILTHFVNRRGWSSVDEVLSRGVSDTECRWAVEDASKQGKCKDFEFVLFISDHVTYDHYSSVLALLARQERWECMELIFSSDSRIKKSKLDRFEDVRRLLSGDPIAGGSRDKEFMLNQACKLIPYGSPMNEIPEFARHLGKRVYNILFKSCKPEALSIVLRYRIQKKHPQWDVISRTCVSSVWEQVRRELFRAAVEQRQWAVVMKWANHELYDDQRWWALNEAYNEKQWDVMLLLADHGLTDIELLWVYYRLAKWADWQVVLRMFDRGVDITEVKELVENVMIDRKTARDKLKHNALQERYIQLVKHEENFTNMTLRAAFRALKTHSWSIVLYVCNRNAPQNYKRLALKEAMQCKAWHVLMQIVKLGMDAKQRDLLFKKMLKTEQWNVCRVLLEEGVSVQLCLDALPYLLKMNQWTLAARVMEYDIDDSTRKQVMRWAMDSRQGSLVSHCIRTMQDCCMSELERKRLFEEAVWKGILQSVEPLVEKKDPIGIEQRDKALFAAIEQKQWDVVDYCQFNGADNINVADAQGDIPIVKAVIEKDWKSVNAILVRDGDPSLLCQGRCLLNLAIEEEQWDTVKLLIQYHGDIHYTNFTHHEPSPLQCLIDKRQGEIIDLSLIWCPGQSEVVNVRGETTLHATALDKKPELLYYQVVRGVDPLRVTNRGHSVLLYAALNNYCSQKMVAECIRLGFATQQPQLTGQIELDSERLTDFIKTSHRNPKLVYPACDLRRLLFSFAMPDKQLIPSACPMLIAVARGMPILAHMLYESGSCSHSQLLTLYNQCVRVTVEVPKQDATDSEQDDTVHGQILVNIKNFLPELQRFSTTPRSLKSTCRLVISRQLTVRGRRERDVNQLREEVRNDIMFSDLTNPNYLSHLYGTVDYKEDSSSESEEDSFKDDTSSSSHTPDYVEDEDFRCANRMSDDNDDFNETEDGYTWFPR